MKPWTPSARKLWAGELLQEDVAEGGWFDPKRRQAGGDDKEGSGIERNEVLALRNVSWLDVQINLAGTSYLLI